MNIYLIDYHLNFENNRVLTYYKGPFDEIVLQRIGLFIRNQNLETPKANARLFSIFIELAQNISYYSLETNVFDLTANDYGVGTIAIYDTDSHYILVAGNMIEKEFGTQIVERCQEINSLNRDELRKLKRELRKQPRREGHKGGNIGLVHIALKSEEPLEIKSLDVNEKQAFFVITTKIKK